MKTKKKNKKRIVRNWVAVAAIYRSGAGKHPDHKKDQDRKACRGNSKKNWE